NLPEPVVPLRVRGWIVPQQILAPHLFSDPDERRAGGLKSLRADYSAACSSRHRLHEGVGFSIEPIEICRYRVGRGGTAGPLSVRSVAHDYRGRLRRPDFDLWLWRFGNAHRCGVWAPEIRWQGNPAVHLNGHLGLIAVLRFLFPALCLEEPSGFDFYDVDRCSDLLRKPGDAVGCGLDAFQVDPVAQ